MKKIFLLATLFALTSGSLFAQSSAPRFGTTPNADNTGRVLTYAYTAQTFANTLHQNPNAFQSFYTIGKLTHALTDTMSTAGAHICDRVTLYFLCDTLTAGRVVTFGGHNLSTGTLTVDQNQRATITFIFDGTYWLEMCRFKQ